MSAAAREAQCTRRLAAVALLLELAAARGADRRRLDLALLAGPLRRVQRAGDERDDVARAADEDRVADAHVARADDLLVGERGAADRRSRDEHGLEDRDRGDLADLADVPDDVAQDGRLLLGRVLER